MEPFLGQIQEFGFNFAPRNWAKCHGQLMAISSNTSLFSLLGIMYGGDGRTTFGLPDLRGRSIVHAGHGTGLLNNMGIGKKGGSEHLYLNWTNIPAHNHEQLIPVNSEDEAMTDDPANNVIGNSGTNAFNTNASPNKFLAHSYTGNSGSGATINNRNPYLGMNTCIALTGIFPSRQ